MKRTRLLKIIIPILAISVSAFFIPWMIIRASIAPLPNTVQKQVDKAISYNLDGIIVYVNQSGQKPQWYAAGWQNKAQQEPMNPKALFKIASISKLYIAVAAAKLVNDGTLSLDKTLVDYFPEHLGRIENADQITLRMLLQHRTGIPDWIEDPEFPWDRSITDVEELLALVINDPSEFEPDSRYDYSNTNYLLIGNIIDKTLGYSHQDYIKKKILMPLGLTQTFGLLSEVDSNEVVSGYIKGYDGDVKMLDFVSPGGSMVATAEDVGIFLRALNDGSLLSDDEQAVYSSIYEYGHTGLLPGYQSIARYHKDMDAVVIQFVNTSGGNAWTISEIVYNRVVKIWGKQ